MDSPQIGIFSRFARYLPFLGIADGRASRPLFGSQIARIAAPNKGTKRLNLDDAFERILASLYRAILDDACRPKTSALIDEACSTGAGDRIYYARLLARGEYRQDMACEYFEVHYPHDAGMRRLMDRPKGRPVHSPEFLAEPVRRREHGTGGTTHHADACRPRYAPDAARQRLRRQHHG